MKHPALPPLSTSGVALLAAVLVATAPAEAGAASDLLLRLDGVDGTVRVGTDIDEFQWSKALAGTAFDPFQPAFSGGVRVAVADLVGDGTWDQLVLTATRPDGDSFFRYEMRNVIVSSYAVSGAGASGDHRDWVMIESMSSPIFRWAPRQDDGSPGDWLSGTWDADTGRFIGDAAVFGAFDDLGAVRWPDGTLAISAVPEPADWALWLLGGAALARRLHRARARP